MTQSYLEQIKAANSDAYAKIADLAKYTANEAFGGTPQDWQAQIFTPLSQDLTAQNKTLGLKYTPVTTRYVGIDEEGNPAYQRTGGEPILPEGVKYSSYRDDEGNDVGFYSKSLGAVNGIPVTANYDMQGNLTGYQGDQSVRNWLDGSHSVGGAWDANGKPVPVQYASHSGSFFGGLASDLAGGFGGYLPALANFVLPGAGLAISAANAALNGGSLSDVAKNAAISYAAGQLGGAANTLGDQAGAAAQYGTDLGSQQSAMLAAQEAGMKTAGDTLGNVAGSTVAAAARGQDPLSALISSGMNAGVSEIASQVPGFSDLSPKAQSAVSAAIAAELQGKDPTQGLINSALNIGISAAKDQSSPDVVQQLTDSGMTDNNPDMISGYFAPGGDGWSPSSDATPASDTNLVGGYIDETTGNWIDTTSGSEVDTGKAGPLTNENSGTNLDSMNGYTYDPATNNWTSPDGTVTDLSYLSNTRTPLTGKQVEDSAAANSASAQALALAQKTAADVAAQKVAAQAAQKLAAETAAKAAAKAKSDAVDKAIADALAAKQTAQQNQYNALLSMMGSNNDVAHIKSNTSLFGAMPGTQAPAPSAQQTQSNSTAQESPDTSLDQLFASGGHVNEIDVDTLLDILRS